METPKICIQSSWKEEQNSKSTTPECHCTFPHLGKLVACFMPGVSHSDDSSILCSAGKRSHPLPRNFSSPSFQWATRALSPQRKASLKATKRSLQAMDRDWLQVSLLRVCLLGQERVKAIRATTKAKILNIISCKWPFSGFLLFTVLLSARALGPSKPGARF